MDMNHIIPNHIKRGARLFTAVAAACVAVLAGCSGSESDPREKEAAMLYQRLCKVTRLYTDSIGAASDSAQINALFERYEKEFDRISFDVSPDTDIFLTEGENDTISMLQSRLLNKRLQRLKVNQVHLASDTVKGEPESELPAGKSKGETEP